MAGITELINTKLPKLEADILKDRAFRYGGKKYYRSFQVDKTKDFIGWIEDRLGKQQANVIIQLYGIGGTGKSYSLISLAYQIESIAGAKPGFEKDGLERIFFMLSDASKHQKNIKRKQVITIDERAQNYGLGSERLQDELEHIVETAREPQNSILVASVPPYLYDHAHFMLESMFIDREAGFSYFSLQDKHQYCLGYVKVETPERTVGPAFLKKYLKKKRGYNDFLRHKKSHDYIKEMGLKALDDKRMKELEKRILKQKKKKKITRSMLDHLVAELYPHLKRNNEHKAIVEFMRNEGMLKRGWSC